MKFELVGHISQHKVEDHSQSMIGSYNDFTTFRIEKSLMYPHNRIHQLCYTKCKDSNWSQNKREIDDRKDMTESKLAAEINNELRGLGLKIDQDRECFFIDNSI